MARWIRGRVRIGKLGLAHPGLNVTEGIVGVAVLRDGSSARFAGGDGGEGAVEGFAKVGEGGIEPGIRPGVGDLGERPADSIVGVGEGAENVRDGCSPTVSVASGGLGHAAGAGAGDAADSIVVGIADGIILPRTVDGGDTAQQIVA